MMLVTSFYDEPIFSFQGGVWLVTVDRIVVVYCSEIKYILI